VNPVRWIILGHQKVSEMKNTTKKLASMLWAAGAFAGTSLLTQAHAVNDLPGGRRSIS